jgi:hypothetical protein
MVRVDTVKDVGMRANMVESVVTEHEAICEL